MNIQRLDAGHGAHLTISLYGDPSGAEQSTRDAANWAAEAVAELIEGPPEITTGWVRIHVDADESTVATPAPYLAHSGFRQISHLAFGACTYSQVELIGFDLPQP